MSEKQVSMPRITTVWASGRALSTALRGNALGAFPREAFEEEAVAYRILGHTQFIFNRAEAIRWVLVDNSGNYVRPAPTIRVLSPIFGRGLFLSTGEAWKHQRRTVAPAFAPRAVRILARHVAAAGNSLVADLAAAGNRRIDLLPIVQSLSLGIIGSAMFSLEMEKYGAELRQLILRYAARLGRPTLLDFMLPLRVPTPYDLGRLLFRRRWSRLVQRVIRERSRRVGDGNQRDLFDLLLIEQKDNEDPSAQLVDQIATILVAGHETSAAALFWSLYLMALAPEAQEAVAAEAASADLGPDGAADTVSKLVHARAVVDETLRLYPPAFVIVRQALTEDLVDGIPVPGRSLVLIAPWVLHCHSRLWDRPNVFDPARFLPGAEPPLRFSYMPFGAGPRVCIGAQFALTELVLTLAIVLREFRIELAEKQLVTPVGIVSTQPENPPHFLLHSRTASAGIPASL